jgi:hypothetical protein
MVILESWNDGTTILFFVPLVKGTGIGDGLNASAGTSFLDLLLPLPFSFPFPFALLNGTVM